jgi:hypothetical protein
VTTLPDWAVREPDEEPADWVFRLLVASSVRAVANAEPGWCRCGLMPRLAVHVCDLYAGQPLRVALADLTGPSFRTSGISPVPPRGCGTCHAGECTSEWPYNDRRS